MKIPAEVHADDHVFTADFDALPFFQEASDNEIIELVKCGFGGDFPADEVALHMAALDEGVRDVFKYLEHDPTMGGDKVGFECHVEEGPALAWIKSAKPALYQRLIDEDLINPE